MQQVQRLASTLAADVVLAMQYVEFLSSALSSEAYSSMLPSITDLVHKYNLDIEVALQVVIPCVLLSCRSLALIVPAVVHVCVVSTGPL